MNSKLEYIKNISVKNYFSIENIELKNLASREIYLLGENGTGKTILLQSIFLSLEKEYIEQQNKVEVGIIIDSLEQNEDLQLGSKHQLTNNGQRKNIFAYGTNRNNLSRGLQNSFEFMTLFSSEYKLNSPVDWLIKLYNQENEEKIYPEKAKPHVSLSAAGRFFSDLLEEKVEISVSSDSVEFTENNTELEFEQLSDGYRSILIWVSDLISRMSKTQTWVRELSEFTGVVLIDELDLFLHPKWAYKIMQKLRNWFPKIQFIISTHSPILIMGASSDAIFYKVFKNKAGKIHVSQPVRGISNLMANSIITSPLFDMEQAYSRAYDKEKNNLRLGDDFIYDKIHDHVVEELKSKENVEEKDIMELIRKQYQSLG